MSGEKESGTAKNWKASAGVILRGLGVAAILFLGYAIFRVPIEDLMSKVVVGPILSKIQPDWGFYLTFWVVIGAFLAFQIKKKKWVIGFPKKLYPLAGSVIGIYLSYRVFGWDRWELYPLNGWIKYWDIPIIIGMGTLSLNWLQTIFQKRTANQIHSNSTEKSKLNISSPITKVKNDLFHFKNGAAILECLICETPNNEAIAVGINGAWGSGKTSFMNLMKLLIVSGEGNQQQVKSTKATKNILIDFYPWRSSSPNGIIHDFFEELQKELEKHSPDLGRKIAHYSEKLVAFEDNIFTKMLHLGAGLVYGTHTQSEQYDTIKELIGSLNLKIHIFIDDMDRLGADEIMEVIRIVRNTGNFPNIVYYLAYDKEYVHQQLAVKQVPNPVRFMEKIVQLNYEVPKMDPEELWKNFTAEISKHFKRETTDNIEIAKVFENIDYNALWINLKRYWVEFITTTRETSILFNGLVAKDIGILVELELEQVILLEIIRLRFPNLYSSIWEGRDRFFRSMRVLLSEQKPLQKVLFNEGEYQGNEKKSTFEDFKKEDLIQSLSKSNSIWGFKKNQIELIEHIVLSFWGDKAKSTPKTINNINRFEIYFTENSRRKILLDADLELILTPIDDFPRKFKELPQSQKEQAFNSISNKFPAASNEEFKKLIQITFMFHELTADGRELRRNDFKIWDLFNKIITKLSDESPKTTKALQEFILDQFLRCKTIDRAIVEFYSDISSIIQRNPHVTLAQVKDVAKQFISTLCTPDGAQKDIPIYIRVLRHASISNLDDLYHLGEVNPEDDLRDQVSNFLIENLLKDLLNYLVKWGGLGVENFLFIRIDDLNFFFGTPKNWLDTLRNEQSKNEDITNEIQEFFEIFKLAEEASDGKFNQGVIFDLKYLNPTRI